MKVILLIASILLAELVFSSADDTEIIPIPEECPSEDSINVTVFLKHKSDCTLFYICRNGEKIEETCPFLDQKGNRLHFNAKLQICDRPERAECENYIKFTPLSKTPKILRNFLPVGDEISLPETTTEEWRNPETCIGSCPQRDPEDYSILLQNEDCSKYCLCSNGLPIVNVCPKGLHFSLKDQACTWPIDAKCPQDSNDFSEHLDDWLFRPRNI